QVDDEMVGVLAVGDVTGRVFGEQRRLLEVFAEQAAVGLRLSQLHRQTRKRLTQTQMVLALSQSVGAVPHPGEILRRTLRELGRSLGADTAGAWQVGSGVGCVVVCSGSDVAMDSVEPHPKAGVALDVALVMELKRRRGPIHAGIGEGEP